MSAIEGWKLRSGESVYDRPKSHLAPEVLAVLAEALQSVDSLAGRDFIEATVGLGRIVGKTICVETGPESEIIFAQRPGRRGMTRFVKGAEPVDTELVSVVLKKCTPPAEGYFVVTALFGPKSRHEPWDHNATDEAVPYWQKHALAWMSCPYEVGSEVRECPQYWIKLPPPAPKLA